MKKEVYLKIERNIEVSWENITVGDVACIFCEDKSIEAKIKTLKLVNIEADKKKRVCFSCMYVIELIKKACPDVEVNNLGETDFIVDYVRQKKHSKTIQMLMITFVALFTFVGSVYAIIAYNNDVGTLEIFERVYKLLDMEQTADLKLLEVAYAVGLAGGIIVFYNHFGGKRFTTDPTPIEVEMDKYEKDVDDTLIGRSSAMNKEKV